MDELLRELLDKLDVVGTAHEEIYDSECREQMGEPIFHIFIKPNMSYVVPQSFGLYDENAKQLVSAALVSYATSARELAAKMGINTFHSRLSAFQNGEIVSRVEKNYFDDFFGWMNPEFFDPTGNVIQSGG